MTDISHHCPQAGTLRLVVQGPLTIYDAQALKNRLLELLSEVPLQALELDLAQVPEIDTSGELQDSYAVVPAYRHPGKNWRLKKGAMPQWYKARSGVRTKALSGAARVARYRPQKFH